MILDGFFLLHPRQNQFAGASLSVLTSSIRVSKTFNFHFDGVAVNGAFVFDNHSVQVDIKGKLLTVDFSVGKFQADRVANLEKQACCPGLH